MAGQGMASAMRRRTRNDTNRNVTINEEKNVTNNFIPPNAEIIRPEQILVSHELRIKELQKQITTVSSNNGSNIDLDEISKTVESKMMENLNNLEKSIEKKIDDKLSLINNNLMFVIKNLDETTKLSKSIEDSTNNDKTMIETINNKLQAIDIEILDFKREINTEVTEFKETYIKNMQQSDNNIDTTIDITTNETTDETTDEKIDEITD